MRILNARVTVTSARTVPAAALCSCDSREATGVENKTGSNAVSDDGIATAWSCGHSAARLLSKAQTFKVLAVYKRSAYLSACLPGPGAEQAAGLEDSSIPAAPGYRRILCVNASELGRGPLQLATDQFEIISSQLKPGLRILNNTETAMLQFCVSRCVDYRRALSGQTRNPAPGFKQTAKSLQFMQPSQSPGSCRERQSQSVFTQLSTTFLVAATTATGGNYSCGIEANQGLFRLSMDYLSNEGSRLVGHTKKSDRTLTGSKTVAAPQSLWQKKLLHSCEDIALLCRSSSIAGSSPQAFGGLLDMLGRGPGLTPAGDDFVSGVFIALQVLGDAEKIQVLRNVLEPQLPGRTHEISAAHLSEAFDGHITDRSLSVVQAMFDLLNVHHDTAVKGKKTDDVIRLATERLAVACNAIGASSGWDFLAGMLVTLHIQISQSSSNSFSTNSFSTNSFSSNSYSGQSDSGNP